MIGDRALKLRRVEPAGRCRVDAAGDAGVPCLAFLPLDLPFFPAIANRSACSVDDGGMYLWCPGWYLAKDAGRGGA